MSDPTAPTLFMTEVRVSDWPGAVAWYSEVLGLGVTLRDEPQGFALLGPGPTHLALRRGVEPPGGAVGVRLIFRVDDLDATRARLVALGADPGAPSDNPREGYREVRLVDPWGVPLTLFAWTAARGAIG